MSSSLVFLGDTAWPRLGCLDLSGVEAAITDAAVVLNLEGPLLQRDARASSVNNEYKFNLYSCREFLAVAKALNVVACGVANNHATDYAGGLARTCETLEKAGIACFGTNRAPSFRCRVGDAEHIIVGVCSPVTEIREPDGNIKPLLLSPQHLVCWVETVRARNPGATITVFVHWGYELMPYPLPADRELARRLIERGANYVIGHHPHVVQPVEPYRTGLIVYSLGNFALPQTDFRGRTLTYRDASVMAQLGLRVQGNGASLIRMHYDKESATVLVTKEIAANEAQSEGSLAPFIELDDKSYRTWFREFWRNNPTRPRFLPVFDSYFGYGRIESGLKQTILETRWAARRAAIQLGLHTPYNW